VILLVMAGSGCVSALDYERARGELQAVRAENVRLRGENDELHRGLAKATTKLTLIDSIIHDGKMEDWPPAASGH
jgi:hypothetical protein